MPRILRDRKTLYGALLASLTLHALVTPFFAPLSASFQRDTLAVNGRDGNERVRATTVGRISIESRRTIHVPRAPARPATPRKHRLLTSTPIVPKAPSPALTVASAVVAARDAFAKRPPVVRVGIGGSAGRPRAAVALAITIATAAPESQLHFMRPSARERAEIAVPTAPSQAPSPLATAESTPVVGPAPADSARVVAVRAESGIPAGGWGASFEKPLVADESALDDLRARYRGARAVSVDVDESGHATRVVASASLSADLRAALEHDLLALRYVPAECNGLRCEGTLQLIL